MTSDIPLSHSRDQLGRHNSAAHIRTLINSGQFVLVEDDCSLARAIFLATERMEAASENRPLLVSLVGGAASGKSTFAAHLAKFLNAHGRNALVVSTDDFLLGTRKERQQIEEENPLQKYNFHLMKQVLLAVTKLAPGESICIPTYNPVNGAGIPPGYSLNTAHSFKVPTTWSESYRVREVVAGVDCIIVEGDFSSPLPSDFAIYLHVDDEARLKRRIHRDLSSRRYPGGEEIIVKSFERRQKIQHYPFTLPIAQVADLLIWGRDQYLSAVRDSPNVLYNLFDKVIGRSLEVQIMPEAKSSSLNWRTASRNHVVAHDGIGEIELVRLLSYDSFETAAHFVDFAIIPPGASVGEHTHYASEELYFILSGTGIMYLDGSQKRVHKGDIILNPLGGTHSLINDGKANIEMLVIEIGLSRAPEAHDPPS